MKQSKRNERRARTIIKYIKRLEHAYQTMNFTHGQSFAAFMRSNIHWLTKLKDTGTICSCYACGNPRKYLKELTRAEIIAIDAFREQINEYINTR